MKLYIYVGEALRHIIPSGFHFDFPARNDEFLKVHEKEIPYGDARRVYLPEERLTPFEQVDKVESILVQCEGESNIQIFTHSPYVLDMAYWTGKKLGYEVKAFNVIYADKERTEVKFEDPTGDNFELPWKSLNRALHVIDKVQKEVESEG